MFNIISSLLIILFSFCFSLFLIFKLREGLCRNLGVAAFYVVLLIDFLIQFMPMMWLVGLLPVFTDDLSNPAMFGIGGESFGLQYEQYIITSLVFVSCAWCALLPFILMAMVKESKNDNANPVLNDYFKSISIILNRNNAGFISCLASLVLFILFFAVEGFDRIWASDLGRFETLGTSEIFDSRLFMIIAMGLTFANCLSGVVVKRWGWSIIGLFLISPLFIVYASRALTMAFFAILIVLYLRHSKFWRIVLSPIYIIIALFAYTIPLDLRFADGTGILYLLKTIGSVISGNSFASGSHTIQLLQNIGLGFPVLNEAISLDYRGANIMEACPLGYKLLSFSPTPSVIDGYRDGFHQYVNMINGSTPHNLFGECYSIMKLLPQLAFLFFGFSWSIILRYSKKSVLLYFYISCIAVFSIVAVGIFSQQYLIRQTTRYFYYPIIMVIFILIWSELKKTLNSSSRA
jgi:hypothetical protein